MSETDLVPGAAYLGGSACRFVVWAPECRSVEIRFSRPAERNVKLAPTDRGYHVARVDEVEPGSLYKIRLDDRPDRPDPASRFQPQGVHGPSQVVDPAYPWADPDWRGIPLQDLVFYEIHVGAFTREGTFEAVIPHLRELKDLGVTAIELMPVAQFPGDRNWGYDGAFPFAVQDSYGGPIGLKKLVNACHGVGLGVVLDVVYNHLGPEGNYLWGAAPYFTDAYKTPWGPAVNFDGPWSDEVRRFFIENALMWIREFHVDALRLDALHAIVDTSARTFLEDLAQQVHGAAQAPGRHVFLVAESDRNDARLVLSADQGGIGLDALWNDDFHHALHALLTGERTGYYRDFGELKQMGLAFTRGFVYAGEYSAHRRRRHGNAPSRIRGEQLVVFSQNHDQVGNRRTGDRLSRLVSYEKLKLAAGAVILAPGIPLLFMGEEYGETAPFLYFVSHGDPALIEAVRRGRLEEFRSFSWTEAAPDPQDRATFERCRLDGSLAGKESGRRLRDFYASLLRLRRDCSALRTSDKARVAASAFEDQQVLQLIRWDDRGSVLATLHFGNRPVSLALPVRGGQWERKLDSAEAAWGGPGTSTPALLNLDRPSTLELPPESVVVYVRNEGSATAERAAEPETVA